jgi:hypothetical protein
VCVSVLQLTLPLPSGRQLDWDAILTSSPEDFVRESMVRGHSEVVVVLHRRCHERRARARMCLCRVLEQKVVFAPLVNARASPVKRLRLNVLEDVATAFPTLRYVVEVLNDADPTMLKADDEEEVDDSIDEL